jgi:hypothetical protein
LQWSPRGQISTPPSQSLQQQHRVAAVAYSNTALRRVHGLVQGLHLHAEHPQRALLKRPSLPTLCTQVGPNPVHAGRKSAIKHAIRKATRTRACCS